MAPAQPEWTLVDFVSALDHTVGLIVTHRSRAITRYTEGHGGRECCCSLALVIRPHKTCRHSGILALNICLVLPLLTAWSNGLDSSLINGLQILPAWQEYFHDPNGKILGLLNSSQNIGSLYVRSRLNSVSMSDHVLRIVC
jgi:hypothetical protein